MIRSYNPDQYVWMLESAYRAGWRVFDPDFATASDAEIYEKLRRDPDVASAFNIRLHGVACRDWRVALSGKPSLEEKTFGGIVEDAMKEIEGFTSARLELAHAVIRGSSWGFVRWGRRFTRLGPPGTPRMSWVVPLSIKDVDRRRMRYGLRRNVDPSTGMEVIDTPLEMRSTTRGQWERVRDDAPFITLTYQDEECRLGYGRGLIEALYFYHFLKGKLLTEGMQGISRWAQGMVVLGIDGLREAQYTNSNDIIQSAVIDALKKFQSRHVLVKDKTDDLEIKESSGSGNDMVLEFIHEMNRAMRVLVLGSDLPFGGDRGKGSTEMADAQAAVSAELIDFDRELLDEAITKFIIRKFVWYNRPNLQKLGMLGMRIPRFTSINERLEDPEAAASVFETIHRNGLAVRRDELYKKVRYSVPIEGDDIIEGSEEPDLDGLFGMPGMGGEEDGDEGGGEDPTKKDGKFPPAKGKPEAKPKRKPGSGSFRRAFLFNAMLAHGQRREEEPMNLTINNAPAPALAPAPQTINMRVQMPEIPDVQAARDREKMLRAEIDEIHKRFGEAMARPVDVHVEAPKVFVRPQITVEAAKAPDVRLEVAPPPPANVQVTVAAPPPANVVVNIPEQKGKRFGFQYDKDGKLKGAESTPK
jgi:hypothetical protein